MNKKQITALCVCLLLGFHAYAGEAAPFDPRDHVSRQNEKKRIMSEYGKDLPRLTEELERFAGQVAKATGNEAVYNERRRLHSKYGPVSHSTEILPMHGSLGTVIDNSAWNVKTTKVGFATVISFALDKTRYRDAVPVNLTVQLRRRGRAADEESSLRSGAETTESFRINLAYEKRDDGSYTTKLTVPRDEAGDFVIQIAADIEKGWAAETSVDLTNGAASRFEHHKASLIGDYYETSEVSVQPNPKSMPSPDRIEGEYGTVTVEYIVEVDGNVSQCVVSNSTNNVLHAPALEATKRWKFEPALLDGRPVRCRMQLPMVFTPTR